MPGSVVAVTLRAVEPGDLPTLFTFQNDPVANALVVVPARDQSGFDAHWARILADDATLIRTIVVADEVAGHVLSFERDGWRLIGYWLGRRFWGQGIATQAVPMVLALVEHRPVHAHVAKHNIGSRRILERCGFELTSTAVDPVDQAEIWLYELGG